MPTRATASPSADCTASGLRLEIGRVNSVDSGGRVRMMGLLAVNCGLKGIELKGSPKVVLLDRGKKALKAKVRPGVRGIPLVDGLVLNPSPVWLYPGDTAATWIVWRVSPGGRATFLDVKPGPARPVQRLTGASVDLGRTTAGVGSWALLRSAAGTEPGDGAPHYADNNGWKRRKELTQADRLKGAVAAGRFRPALEKLRERGDFAPAAVTAALVGRGAPPDTTGSSPFRPPSATNDPAPPGAVWSTLLDGRICVMGTVSPSRVTATVDGLNGEGTCLEAFSH